MRLRRVVKKLFGLRRKGQKPAELSTPTIHRAILRAIRKAAPAGLAGDCLDVGSGANSSRPRGIIDLNLKPQAVTRRGW